MHIKNISIWATKNPKTSIAIIAVSHILVLVISIFLGVQLFISDWGESKSLLTFFIGLFSICYLINLNRKRKNFPVQHSFYRQELFDFTFVVCYSIVAILGTNNFLLTNDMEVNQVREKVKAEFIVHKTHPKKEANQKGSKKQFKQKIKQSKREIRREFRTLKREIKKKITQRFSKNERILISILAVIALLYLAIQIALFAYAIGYIGYPVLGVITFVGGFIGLLVLFNRAIKKIWNKR